MSAAIDYPHLRIDEHGVAWIGKSRYKVKHLAAEHYAYGWSAEELLRQHPDLRPQEVYAALGYFYDHMDRLVAEIRASVEKVDTARPAQSLTRDELLQRQSAQGP
jgi:uncharacterized protein (DUF433 family)